ncbi:MAG: glycosyltransferase family 2 protein [Pseudomonadota bacterium]
MEIRTRDSADGPEAAPPSIAPSDILVVLPALNEAAHIEECIRSLMRPGKWMGQCRIVIADGGSTDRTTNVVRSLATEFPNLHLIDNPGRFQSSGVNTAVRQMAEQRHRLLVRCDVHAIYPEGYVQALALEHARMRSASVVTAMDATGSPGFQQAAAWIVDTPLGSGGSAHRGGRKAQFVDHGHHAAFDLDWFRRIGGYDPTMSHNEDAEYDLRLRRCGGRIWLTDQTRVGYVMRPNLAALCRQYWNYGRGRAHTLSKHKTRPRLRQIIPVINVVLLLASGLLSVLTPLGFLWPSLYLCILFGTSLTAAIRLNNLQGLWAGPALGAMHLSWGMGFLYFLLAPSRNGHVRIRNRAEQR